MLQRIQTVYLIFALLVTGALPFLFPLWETTNGKPYFFMADTTYVVLFGLSTTLSLLNLLLLGLFVYRTLNVSGETVTVSEKGIGMFLPIVSIVLLVLANKAIKKDEDLVKSVDRLR